MDRVCEVLSEAARSDVAKYSQQKAMLPMTEKKSANMTKRYAQLWVEMVVYSGNDREEC